MSVDFSIDMVFFILRTKDFLMYSQEEFLMSNEVQISNDGFGLTDSQIKEQLKRALSGFPKLDRVLLIPPDVTRLNAYAGEIYFFLYQMLEDSEVFILPALGTHMPMTQEELNFMFPGIPTERFLVHDWRHDVKRLGEVPSEFLYKVSQVKFDRAIPVEVNRQIVDPSYDLVISIGQVVPHEVVGMANYNKNLFVGCGGKAMINSSHYLGALYGMECMMGRDHTPVHQVFDYAEEHFLQDVPLLYCLTVTTTDRENRVHVQSLATGRGRDIFSESIKVSQKHNLVFLEKPLKKVLVYLKPEELCTTWVRNKAIYRTRMAMVDDGDLIIIAPGVRKFGEDPENDRLIFKYGYHGTAQTMLAVAENQDLQDGLGVAAHLIHGSSEGRFNIYYAPGYLSQEQIEAVGFHYLDLSATAKRYKLDQLVDGFNMVDGEEVFYISNPALGLWAWRERFFSL